ncbi:hypothetical protein [Nocardia fluminea]|uniref:hypothetical protein n=1 Tax=Nocardia fluminea TaxID=134984 RepID=UPI003D124FA4
MITTGIPLAVAVLSGLLWWVRQDGGLVRTVAGLVAALHPDPVRRRDARLVLRATKYVRGSEPGTENPQPGKLPPSAVTRRGRRGRSASCEPRGGHIRRAE